MLSLIIINYLLTLKTKNKMKTNQKSIGLKTKFNRAVAAIMLAAMPLIFSSCEKESVAPFKLNFEPKLNMNFSMATPMMNPDKGTAAVDSAAHNCRAIVNPTE